jgi:hypothetical protein
VAVPSTPERVQSSERLQVIRPWDLLSELPSGLPEGTFTIITKKPKKKAYDQAYQQGYEAAKKSQ